MIIILELLVIQYSTTTNNNNNNMQCMYSMVKMNKICLRYDTTTHNVPLCLTRSPVVDAIADRTALELLCSGSV